MTYLDAACVSANVSYKNGPYLDETTEILRTGILPRQFFVHINHILTETPRTIIESAAIEATGDQTMALENIKKLEDALAAFY